MMVNKACFACKRGFSAREVIGFTVQMRCVFYADKASSYDKEALFAVRRTRRESVNVRI